MNLLHERDLAGLGALPLTLPAPELTLDVVLLLAELTEPDGVRIDGVDGDERVHDAHADRATVALVGKGIGVGALTQDRTLDEVHDVERCAVDRFVGAIAGDRSDGDVGSRESGDHPVLAPHVVR